MDFSEDYQTQAYHCWKMKGSSNYNYCIIIALTSPFLTRRESLKHTLPTEKEPTSKDSKYKLFDYFTLFLVKPLHIWHIDPFAERKCLCMKKKRRKKVLYNAKQNDGMLCWSFSKPFSFLFLTHPTHTTFLMLIPLIVIVIDIAIVIATVILSLLIVTPDRYLMMFLCHGRPWRSNANVRRSCVTSTQFVTQTSNCTRRYGKRVIIHLASISKHMSFIWCSCVTFQDRKKSEEKNSEKDYYNSILTVLFLLLHVSDCAG